MALLTVGGLLVASAFRRAEHNAVAATRSDMMRRFQRARRRGSDASSVVVVLIGLGVAGYVLVKIGRQVADEARELAEDARELVEGIASGAGEAQTGAA